MSSKQDLVDSIQQYANQLSQVEQALAGTSDATERKSLENLKADLDELLKLTQETLEHEYGSAEPASSSSSASSNIDDEFALFMSEINGLDAGTNDPPPEAEQKSVPAAFQDLVGSKCSAPHTHKWGSKSYHNALICSVDASNLDEVLAKVLFINPTHQEMVPCNYFLEGDCRFDEEKCRFSHGAVVALIELKDYQEPQFELLRNRGGKVLAKQKNRIWGKGIVKETNFLSKTCKIQMEEGKHELELAFEDILPLSTVVDKDGDDLSEEDDASDSSDNESEDDLVAERQAQIIQRSLLNPVASQRLGEWEKHTRGIGSKIMQKMGYIVGAGLGSQGEGIVVPVSAQVLPQGRSLDYCMQLREQANGDSNLFSVEKKLQRQKQIQEKQAAKQYAQQKQRKDVFTFMNSEIFGSEGGSSSNSPNGRKSIDKNNHVDIQSCSSKNLNITSLKLSEQCKRLEMDIRRLSQSLGNHSAGSKIHDNLKKQISDKRREIDQLQKTEYSITREQQLRSDKRKMTVF